ncbi:uncharacterized protein LOC118488828 [Helianthus annuus]|uniref:uncharacterized protein LOC118488828 n=1 Tax=Helianthus annuus TaxID=4232 RepID=UPI001652D41A|nr:uncharacterized protein LOC118488828 [Helianthus annuus]
MNTIVKDDLSRVRAVCKGQLPNFHVDEVGVYSQIDICGAKSKGKSVRKQGDKSNGKYVKNQGDKSSSKRKGHNVQSSSKCASGSQDNIKDKNVGERGNKSDPQKKECPWIILVSKEKNAETWMVKTLVTKHKCLESRSVYHCTSTFLYKQLMEQIEENPTIPVKALQDQFHRKYQVEVSRMKAFRAKNKALAQLHGDYEAQYSVLRDYCAELVKTNPGTTVKIEVEPCTDPRSNTRKFRRIYVCLGSLKQGFKAIGRPLLGLDGAFIKGPYPGQGIIPAIQKVFPYAEHRYCLRHIHENMKITFKGKAYKDMIWKLATSSTIEYFEENMQELKAFNAQAQIWLSSIHPKHWSKSHFSGRALSDVILNNMCEVFNSKILDARDKPVITLLEFIREYLMRRIVNVLRVQDGCDGLLTPYGNKKFEEIKHQASRCSVIWNGEDHYQVKGPTGFGVVVDLKRRSCTCRKWEITGLPCKHVVAAIWNKNMYGGRGIELPETYVHPVYTMERWKQVYRFKIYPINGRTLWPKTNIPTILTAPKYHKPIGRPKKARKKSTIELEEATKGGRLSKRGTIKTCSKCGKARHNSRTCKGQEQS